MTERMIMSRSLEDLEADLIFALQEHANDDRFEYVAHVRLYDAQDKIIKPARRLSAEDVHVTLRADTDAEIDRARRVATRAVTKYRGLPPSYVARTSVYVESRPVRRGPKRR